MKMRLNGLLRRAAALLAVLLLVVMLPGSVMADAQTESEEETFEETVGLDDIRIHLHSGDGSIKAAGVRMSLYRIASGSYFGGTAQLLPEYAGFTQANTAYPDLDTILQRAASASLALRDWIAQYAQIAPVATEVSDANGTITFGGVEDGVYLAVQTNGENDFDGEAFSYTVEPYLITVPWQTGDQEFSDEIDCDPKLHYADSNPETTTIAVEKHWEDNNNAAGIRPAAIDVTLYKNGEGEDTVTLDASNNWRYEWTGLLTTATWTVEETAVPSGYASTVTREDNTFVITNKVAPDEPTPGSSGSPTPSPSGSVTPTPSGGVTPTPSGGIPPTTTPGGSSSSGKTSTVLTGDTTQPVLYLVTAVLAAVVLILLLVLRKKRRGK